MRTTFFTLTALFLIFAGIACLAQTQTPQEQPAANQPAPAQPQGPPMVKLEPSTVKPGTPQRPPSQTPPPATAKQGHWDGAIKRLDDQLKLTEDQKSKIKAIWEDETKQSQAVYRDTTMAPQKKRDSLQAIQKKSHDDIRKLLTTDQQKQYDLMTNPGKSPAPGSAANTAATPTGKPAAK